MIHSQCVSRCGSHLYRKTFAAEVLGLWGHWNTPKTCPGHPKAGRSDSRSVTRSQYREDAGSAEVNPRLPGLLPFPNLRIVPRIACCRIPPLPLFWQEKATSINNLGGTVSGRNQTCPATNWPKAHSKNSDSEDAMGGGVEKTGGKETSRMTPLPKRGFGPPPLVQYVFHPPQVSALCFCRTKVHTTDQNRSSFGGLQKLSRERVLWYVFLPPCVLHPPPISRPNWFWYPHGLGTL